MKTRNFGLALAIAGAAIATAASAHHSPAAFDITTRQTVTGVVKSAFFRNPHGEIVVSVRDNKGRVTDWKLETSAANLLRRRGWDFSQVRPGMTASFVGHPNKTVPNYVYIREIHLPNGTVFGDKGGNDKALD